jgi:hypothetical protein
MEVVSPGTRQRDEVTKVREHAEAGIPEYWLVDPEAGTVTVYTLAGGKRVYGRGQRAGRGEVARSATLGARPPRRVRAPSRKPERGAARPQTALAGFEVAVDELLAAS